MKKYLLIFFLAITTLFVISCSPTQSNLPPPFDSSTTPQTPITEQSSTEIKETATEIIPPPIQPEPTNPTPPPVTTPLPTSTPPTQKRTRSRGPPVGRSLKPGGGAPAPAPRTPRRDGIAP